MPCSSRPPQSFVSLFWPSLVLGPGGFSPLYTGVSEWSLPRLGGLFPQLTPRQQRPRLLWLSSCWSGFQLDPTLWSTSESQPCTKYVHTPAAQPPLSVSRQVWQVHFSTWFASRAWMQASRSGTRIAPSGTRIAKWCHYLSPPSSSWNCQRTLESSWGFGRKLPGHSSLSQRSSTF